MADSYLKEKDFEFAKTKSRYVDVYGGIFVFLLVIEHILRIQEDDKDRRVQSMLTGFTKPLQTIKIVGLRCFE